MQILSLRFIIFLVNFQLYGIRCTVPSIIIIKLATSFFTDEIIA